MKVKWFTSIWKRNFLECEFILSLAITGILIMIVYRYNLYVQIFELLDGGARLYFYATIAQVAGALLGFVIAGVAILLTMNKSPAFETIMNSSPHYRTIFDVFTSSAKYFALTTLISLLAIVLDKDTDPHLQVTYLVFWAITISSLRMRRCLWILNNVINIQIGHKK